MRLRSFVATAVVLSATLAARADSFDFTFGSSSSPFSGSGVLTTGTPVAPGEYPILAVTGTAETAPNGADLAISSILAPGTFPTPTNGGTYPPNDNVLFVLNGVGSVDVYGLAFVLADMTQIDLYNPAGSNADALLLGPLGGPAVFEDVPVTITPVASTPEPSTIALLGTGLLGVAGMVRRRLS